MNKTVQIAASGIIGLGVGVLGGYILAERRLEAKYQQLADEEISVMRTKFRKAREEHDDKVVETRQELKDAQEYLHDTTLLIKRKFGVDDVYAAIKDLPEDEEDGYAEYPEEDYEDYEEIVTEQEYTREEVAKEDDEMYESEDELCELGKVDEDRPEPYFIDEEVFSLNEKNYTHSMLTYFINDGILMDETDQVVEDEHPLIGDKLEVIDGTPGLDLAYIRNNRIMLEIEIVIERESFADFATSVGINGS